MNQLAPDHNTISNFRKDNSEAIRKVFKATVTLAKYFELIGGKLLAGDSTKLRAQNSKKNIKEYQIKINRRPRLTLNFDEPKNLFFTFVKKIALAG